MTLRTALTRVAALGLAIAAIAAGGRAQTRLADLLHRCDRVVEARVEKVHELDAGSNRLLELAVTRALMAPEHESRLFVHVREDERRRAYGRAGPRVFLWMLSRDRSEGFRRAGSQPELDALLAGSAAYFIEEPPFPRVESRGVECIEIDARLVALPEDMPIARRRTAANASARHALRSEVHARIARWLELRGATFQLFVGQGRRESANVFIRSDGRGTATDREGQEYDLQLLPEDLDALRAVVERERAHALPTCIGDAGGERESEVRLTVRDEHGTTLVRILGSGSPGLDPDAREALERCLRVQRALLETVGRRARPVPPPVHAHPTSGSRP